MSESVAASEYTPALTRAAFGALAAAVLIFLPGPMFAQLDTVEQLLVVGPLVGVPLGLGLAIRAEADLKARRHRRALLAFQPLAALCAVASVLAPRGATAATVAAPWLLFTALVGLEGLRRLASALRARSEGATVVMTLREPTVALHAALAFLPIGGIWHGIARAGAHPLGFSDAIVRLTATHFHFVTWVVPLFVGRILLEKSQDKRTWSDHALLLVALVGPLLVAAGITVTQLTQWRGLETASALLLAVALLTLGIRVLVVSGQVIRSAPARGLLRASSLTLGLTMVLAALYALSAWPNIPFMVRWHGVFNAIGFAVMGLLGWVIEDQHRLTKVAHAAAA
ncbi:MAG: YndJ family transporter [Deltaproteobacteria bacterium]|nr:YndJ family transporter [Deltaproteobacteria bacterium]